MGSGSQKRVVTGGYGQRRRAGYRPNPLVDVQKGRAANCGARWNRTTDLSIISAGQRLVRQLVYPLTCPFVPRRATKRRLVPLRLGTLWARLGVDITVTVQCLFGPEDNVISFAPWRRLRNNCPHVWLRTV